MRTTVLIDDDIFRRAKAAAAAAGVPLSRLIEEALRDRLRDSQDGTRSRRFRMVTFGEGERGVAHEPEDFTTATEAEDRRRVRS